jgi:nucleotide-binding universal stress UspA family protein
MPRSIVVGTDGSQQAERALEEAIAIAARDDAQLHIVTAFPDPALIRERITSGSTAAPVNLSQVADSVLNRASARRRTQPKVNRPRPSSSWRAR